MKKPAVLVVEDEALILVNLVETLSEAGFDVVPAINADEAIRILETRSDIRVVFTDVNMPGSMDGLALARAVHRRWPPVKLIVASGFVQNGELPTGGLFLPKPYSTTQLADTLRELVR